jgi:hypothetical protein
MGRERYWPREILLSQLESLRIRRGVIGRRSDQQRVLLRWRAIAGLLDV